MDLEAIEKVFDVLATVLDVLVSVFKWLNSNIFSNIGSLVDILQKVVDFFVGLFQPDGFLGGLFSGDGLLGGLFG